MKITKDCAFSWVADPEILNRGGYGARDPNNLTDIEKQLIEKRNDINVLYHISDPNLSYEYDETVFLELDKQYYLISTAGCSCPSPDVTWTVEIGPTTAQECLNFIKEGKYEGRTYPKDLETELIQCIEFEAFGKKFVETINEK